MTEQEKKIKEIAEKWLNSPFLKIYTEKGKQIMKGDKNNGRKEHL